MLHYFIQTITFQLFFLLIYDAFLKKETFFNWNRAYLLVTALLSLIIPFVKISRFKQIISQDYIINLPEIFIGTANKSEINPIQLSEIIIVHKPFWSWEFVFFLGAGLATLIFAFKLVKLLLLLIKNPKHREGKFFIISVLKSNTAFSFFNYIFLGEYLKKEEREAVLKHEMAHVKQKHSLDLLFFELLRILFWFNPLVYMYQKRIMSLHEFTADAQAVKNQSKNKYYQNLLSQVFETKNISFINPFFKQSLIKKRIIMLQKSKSKQINLFKYALLIPLVFGMLVYTSCEKQNEINNDDEVDLSEYTFVIKNTFFQSYEEGNSDELELAIESAKASSKKQRNFLKSNIGYVVWVDKNTKADEFTYSLHHESEKIPDDYSLTHAIDKDGFKYKMFEKDKFQIKGKKTDQIEIDVPFSVIEQVPVFPGCEGLSIEEQRTCMSKSISIHVNKTFNTKLAEDLNLKGRQRINVIFKIDITGNVVGVRSRAPHPDLEVEAIRVIKTLPKMIPGKQKGKKVNVLYSLPIIFQVAD